ncbi:MAG: hypothetical protein OXF82_06055 [Gammaproteobacteria bacterium]|nr:hypothetical protein [Gammaproteobacteria bacterium]
MTFLIDTNIISEVRKGVELARRRNPQRAEALEAWLADVMSGFGNRILPVDADVAEQWGRMNAVRTARGLLREQGECRTAALHSTSR